MYELTCGLADLEQPPSAEMQGLLAALQGQPAHIARFLGLIAGSVPIAEFFSPQSLAAIGEAPPPPDLHPTPTRIHQPHRSRHAAPPEDPHCTRPRSPGTRSSSTTTRARATAPVAVALNTMVIRAAEPVVVDTGMAEQPRPVPRRRVQRSSSPPTSAGCSSATTTSTTPAT